MKLYRNAIILVVIVALMAGAYYFVNKSRNSPGTTETTSDTEIIKLVDYTSDQIESLTLTNAEGTMVIVKDADGTTWKLSAPADFKGNSSTLSNMVINASSMSADKLVEENAADLAVYGLDKPVSLTVKAKDGTGKTLEIGAETPTKDAYYAKLKDSPKVYTLASYTAKQFIIGLKDIKDKAVLALNQDDIINVSMDRKGQNVFKSKKANIGWTLLAPISGNVNAEAIGPMLTALAAVNASSYEELDSKDLAKYGLDNAPYSFEFGTSSASYKLLLGKEKTKGSQIYARLDGSNDVFVLDESAFSFLDKPFKEIIEVFAYIVNIDQVNKIELTMDGKTTTFGLDVYKDADGKSDSDKDKFTMDGKDVSFKDKDGKQPFRNFYQTLIGIGLDEIDTVSTPSGTPEISIKYYLKTDPGTMQVDFISKDANYYYVMRNGSFANILVKKDKGDFGIQGMKDAYKILVDGSAAQGN